MKLIKAFTPFRIGPALYTWCVKAAKASPDRLEGLLKPFLSVDPTGYQWSTLGLVAPLEEGRYVHDLDGRAAMLRFQFNQRILPGTVRDEELQKRLAALAEKTGRDPTKQEYAELREVVEEELLPKAFIRRASIPLIVYRDAMFFCTTSARRIEDAMLILQRLCEARKIELGFEHIETKTSIPFFLGELAREDEIDLDDHGTLYFQAGHSGVFKGDDKRTIRVKDRDLSQSEVANIIATPGYTATELGIALIEGGEAVAEFTLTNKWVIKGIKILNQADEAGSNEDLHATLWLYAQQLSHIYSHLLKALNEDMGEPADETDPPAEEDL